MNYERNSVRENCKAFSCRGRRGCWSVTKKLFLSFSAVFSDRLSSSAFLNCVILEGLISCIRRLFCCLRTANCISLECASDWDDDWPVWRFFLVSFSSVVCKFLCIFFLGVVFPFFSNFNYKWISRYKYLLFFSLSDKFVLLLRLEFAPGKHTRSGIF